MSSLRQYKALLLEKNISKPGFIATPIEGSGKVRIAIDQKGFPAILLPIPTTNKSKSENLSSLQKLKYLELTQNVSCILNEKGEELTRSFSVINLNSNKEFLVEYFFAVCDIFIQRMGEDESQSNIEEFFFKFASLFSCVSLPSSKTAQGLWAELFLIERSKTPEDLVPYWGASSNNRFDFDHGLHKIEVKSSSIPERKHMFSAEQLLVPSNEVLLIASVYTIENNQIGISINQLLERINRKIGEKHADLFKKITEKTALLLGSDLTLSSQKKFDYQVAADSLGFYDYLDIKGVNLQHLPPEVDNVKFRSDLTHLTQITLKSIKSTFFHTLL